MPLAFILTIFFIIMFFWNRDLFDGLVNFVCTLFFTMVILTIVLGIAFICKNITSDEYEEKVYDIQGLENNIEQEYSINGAFVLGCGYVSGSYESDMKYYYFKVDEYGKKLESVSGSDIYIRETNETQPCLIKTYIDYEYNGFFKWLLSNDGEGRIEHKTIIVVPENTIKIDYNVDI